MVPDPPVLHPEPGRLEEATKRPRQHHDRPQPDNPGHPDVHPGVNPDPERGGRGRGGLRRRHTSSRCTGERAGVIGQRQEGQILKELPKHLKDLKWTPLIGMNLKVGPSAVKLELK